MKKLQEFVNNFIEKLKLGKKGSSWRLLYINIRVKFNMFKKRFLQLIGEFQTYITKKKTEMFKKDAKKKKVQYKGMSNITFQILLYSSIIAGTIIFLIFCRWVFDHVKEMRHGVMFQKLEEKEKELDFGKIFQEKMNTFFDKRRERRAALEREKEEKKRQEEAKERLRKEKEGK